MNLSRLSLFILFLVLEHASLNAQSYGDSIIWVHGSKHSVLDVEQIGTPMFPIYKFYNILQHKADYHRLPKVIRQQSSLANLLPYAYGSIDRTAQLSGIPIVEIRNSTKNFTVTELDPTTIQISFTNTSIVAEQLSIFITPGLGNSIGSNSVTQASILTVGHIIQLQLYGKDGDPPGNADSYSINFLVYQL